MALRFPWFRNGFPSRRANAQGAQAPGSRTRKDRKQPPTLEQLECRLAPAAYVVNALTDTGTGSGLTGDLRYCVTHSDSDAGPDTITFASSLTQGGAATITLSNGALTLSNANGVTIQGPGANLLTISGNNASGVFVVSTGAVANLSGLTIAQGTASSGGGIANSGRLTVTSSTLSNDTATVSGGGIFNSATLTVSNTTFSEDRAQAGDGGGILNTGTLTVGGSTFTANTASTLGGGISNHNTLTVTGSTLSVNSATSGGGGLYILSGATTALADTIVAGNTAPASGGPDVDGAVSSASFNNLVGNANSLTGISNATNGNQVGLTTTQVGLSPLGGYGGTTQTLALLPGSLGLGAGAAPTTLSGGLTASATTLTVASNTWLVLVPGSTVLQVDAEQMLVTAVNGTSLTVQRAYNGTSAAAHSSGASVYPAVDGRGQSRLRSGMLDVGAFESQGFTLSVSSGNNQGTDVNLPFIHSLTVTVTANNSVEPVNGGVVTFTAPSTGASATLSGATATISGGTASISATANSTVGSYTISALTTGAGTSAGFALTNNALLGISTISLPNWTAYQAYNQTIGVTGGTSPDTFAVTTGSLPAGLSLNASTGVITGTPTTTSNPTTFTIKTTDAVGATASQVYSVAVSSPVASFSVTAPTTATAGIGFSVTLQAIDSFGNVVTGYNGPVTLTSSDGQPVLVSPANPTLTNGTATVTVTLDTASVATTLTASVGSTAQGQSTSITVNPSSATSFSVSAPTSAATGLGFGVTLTAQDANGNTVTNYSGSVTFTSNPGQTVTVSPSIPTWVNGQTTVTVTLANPGTLTLAATSTSGTVTGTSGSITLESSLGQAVVSGLSSLASWGGSLAFPLVNKATAVGTALQVGLANPVSSYLAANPYSTANNGSGLAAFLRTLSTQTGNLTATVSNVTATTTNNQTTFTLDFNATDTVATALSTLGAQADSLGISLASSTLVAVTTTLNFNFSFVVNQNSGLTPAQAFTLVAPSGSLSVGVAINATNFTSAIDIGFLGATTTNGSIQLNAQASNPSAFDLDLTSFLAAPPTLTTGGTLSLVLPLQATLGTQTAGGTLTISSTNLTTAAPAVQFQNFTGWQDFTTVGSAAVLQMLNQVGGQLGQVAQQTWTNSLPFLNNISLAQAANLASAYQEEVTDQISSWSSTLQRTVADFTTAQDLASLLAQVLDLTPAQVDVQFDPTTNDLTYQLAFTTNPFTNLLAQTLDVNLDQGGLANASLTGSQLGLVPTVTADLTFGINLTPLGDGFVLTPQATLASLNGGAGVRSNGTAAPDLDITLSDGTTFPVSLEGDQTVQDVIAGVSTASGGRVQLSVDANTQTSLDVTQPANTPIALDFTSPATGLTPTTTLASLNNGNGIRTNPSGSDLQVTLTNGTSFVVSLGNAVTIQDLINDFQNASRNASGNQQVQVSINSSGASLLVSQTSQVASNAGSVFTITPIDGSLAATDLGVQHLTVTQPTGSYTATDLGILGSDAASTGTVTGQALSGDSLAKHAFLQNVTLSVSIAGTARQVNGSADLGAVGLNLDNGSGTFAMGGSLTIQNATLQQLANALNGTTPLGSLVTTQLSGNANLDIPLQLSPTLAGFTLPTGAEVVVAWPDITNPATLTVTVTPAINFSDVTIAPVLQALESAEQFIQTQSAALLGQQIPGLGLSLGSLIDPSSELSAAISNLTIDAPSTIDALVTDLSGLLGTNGISFDSSTNVLEVNLNYNFMVSQNITLGFNLAAGSSFLGSIADVNGAAPITLGLNGSVVVGLNIDLSQPSNPQVYVQDTSHITVGAVISATGLSFSATVGPLGLLISGGSVQLDNGTPGNPATFTVGLNPSDANGQWTLAQAVGQIKDTITGRLDIVLPTFFPTILQPLDPSTPNIELHIGDLTDIGGTTTTKVPDFSAALDNLSLDGITNQLVDGWDGVIRLLETIFAKQINSVNIPIVGGQLQQALNFLQQIDDGFTSQLSNAADLDPTTVQNALYNALGPSGLQYLAPLDSSGGVTEDNYVQLQYQDASGNPLPGPEGAENVHYQVKLQKNLFTINVPIGVNLGLSGLGLAINGNATLQAGFDVTLGFGLSLADGFYLDSTDTAEVSFKATLPASATATLGFLQFSVSTLPGTQLTGDLSLSLNNINGTGSLSLANLASTAAYIVSMNACANVYLQLAATFGGNSDLPQISADFTFTWNLNPTADDPDTLGFSHVTLSLGGFITNLANEIGSVLAPIQPLAEVLTTPIPVISQLEGHDVDLVDLATELGYCSPGTAQFIDAVLTFVNDPTLGIPTCIDLGSFTVDPTTAENPDAEGTLDPATTDITDPDSNLMSSDVDGLSGFQIPLLSNPASAFQLLLGHDVPLVTYQMPAMSLSFGFSQFFPIIGPLGADLAGQIGASAQFSFGFDTSGFRQFAEDDFQNPALILDGFYVTNRANADGTGATVPQAQIYGSIAAYAALDLGFAQAGVGGGLFASINFTLNDPSGTGKIHLQELESDLDKGNLFNVSGSLQAFLDAYLTIDLGFFSETFDFQIATVTLATIGQSPDAVAATKTPQLATINSNGVLQLNIGAYASDRLFDSATNSSPPADGNENLSITAGPVANSVDVSGFGTSETFNNVTEIMADGVAGSDTINVNLPNSDINVDLTAGAGTDNTFIITTDGSVTLTGGSGTGDVLEVDKAASATLTGGSGSETLRVKGSVPAVLHAGSGQNVLDASADSASNVILVGGSGNDTLYGGSGTGDLLFADGASQINGVWLPVTGFNPNKQDVLVAGSGPGQIVYGGDGNDTLVGGSGPDQVLIPGAGDNARLFGGTGMYQVVGANITLLPGSGSGKNDQYFANSNVDQTLMSGSGDGALLAVGWHWEMGTQTIYGNPVGWLIGANGALTPGDDQDGVDIDTAASPLTTHAYTMYAGTGSNVLMIGGQGNDVLHGGIGSITIYGGGGPGTKTIYAGTGDSTLCGGSPLGGGDFSFMNSAGQAIYLSYASTGTHYLYGGAGRDALYGGDGINVGPYTLGGDDSDMLGTNFLYAGSGQNTLWGDSGGIAVSVLRGGSGNDSLYAGNGNDTLVAGSGIDLLQGGGGADSFQLPFNPVTGTTTIPDPIIGGSGSDTLSFVGTSPSPDIYLTQVEVATATGTISGHQISGLTNLVGIHSLTDLVVGEAVQGTGIPANTTIDSVDTTTGTIDLSNDVASGTLSNLSFWKYQATLSDLAAPTLTATVVPASNQVTGLTSTTGLVVGESVVGVGIPADTVITSIDSAYSLSLSNPVLPNPAAPTSSNAFTTLLSFPQIGQVQFAVPDSLGNVALVGSQNATGMPGQLNGTGSNPSAQITNLESTAMLAVGTTVVISIPANPSAQASTVTATITAIDSATSITISTPLSVGATAQLTFPNSLAGNSEIVVDPSVQQSIEIYGGSGSNVLMAGSGNDVIYGGPGNNTIYGGTGNDTLYGGLLLTGYTSGTSTNSGSSPDTLIISSLNTTGLMPGDLVRGKGIPGGATITAVNNGTITVQASSAITTPAGYLPFTFTEPGTHNVLIAGSGNSILYAGDGGDVLIGGSVVRTGSDTNAANATSNVVSQLQAGPAVLDANGNYQLATGFAGRDVLTGGAGNDLMVAAPNSAGVVMNAGSGNDILVGGGGENILTGGPGQDTILGGNLFNIIDSGSVNGSSTTVTGGSGLNFEFAGAGNDTLYDYADAATWSTAMATASQAFHVTLIAPQPIAQLTPNQLDYGYLIPAINQRNQLKNIENGSTTVSGTISPDGRTVTLTNLGSALTGLFHWSVPATITGNQMILDETNSGNISVGEIVAGPGIPDGTVITGIDSTLSVITLSENCQSSNGPVYVEVVIPPLEGMTVTGPGIPAGTTITAVPSLDSVVLSNAITPAGGTVNLTLGLNSQQVGLLQTLTQDVAEGEVADLQSANVLEDVLQGGAGIDNLYGSPNHNTWMVGTNTSGSHTFYNYQPGDFIEGNSTDDTLMVQGIASGSGTIALTYASGNLFVQTSTPTQVAEVGQTVDLPDQYEIASNVPVGSQYGVSDVSTVGLESLGGNATVSANLADASGNQVQLPSGIDSILIQDGGTEANHGNVTMDVSQLTKSIFHLVGGLGNDTFLTSNLIATGSSISPGTAANVLDIQCLSIPGATSEVPVSQVTVVSGLLTLNTIPINPLTGTLLPATLPNTLPDQISFPDSALNAFQQLLVVNNTISSTELPTGDTIQSVSNNGTTTIITLASPVLNSTPADEPIPVDLGLTRRLQTLEVSGNDATGAVNNFSIDNSIPNVTMIGGDGSSVTNTMTDEATLVAENQTALVADISMDEGSGATANDLTANYNTGSLGGGNSAQAPTWTQNGGNLPPGSPTGSYALAFNGSNQYVQVANSPSLSLLSGATYSAWVYFNQTPSAAGHDMAIVSKSEVGNDLDLEANTDNLFHFYAGGTSVASTTVIQADTWYNIAATYSANGTLQLFVNGVRQATTNIIENRTTNTNPLEIGWNSVFSGRWFNGLIAGVQVWNMAESPEQVQANLMLSEETVANHVLMMGGNGPNVTNTFTATVGTNTLIGGTGQNNFNLSGTGVYNVEGGAGSNTLVAWGGTGTLVGGVGQNNFMFHDGGSYIYAGGSGPNELTLTCDNSGDDITMVQNGSTVTVTGAMSVIATNLTGIVAYGSQGGGNTLNASQMIMGVDMIAYAMDNTLKGGAGKDILDGDHTGSNSVGGSVSPGNDTLIAGPDNNQDIIYYVGSTYANSGGEPAGDTSDYQGAGSNPIYFRANPNAYIVVYNDALLLVSQAEYNNGPLVTWNGTTSTRAGTLMPFGGNFSGMGNVIIEDGTSTAHARVAQSLSAQGFSATANPPVLPTPTSALQPELPGYDVFTSGSGYFDYSSCVINPGPNDQGVVAFDVLPGQTFKVATSFLHPNGESSSISVFIWGSGDIYYAIDNGSGAISDYYYSDSQVEYDGGQYFTNISGNFLQLGLDGAWTYRGINFPETSFYPNSTSITTQFIQTSWEDGYGNETGTIAFVCNFDSYTYLSGYQTTASSWTGGIAYSPGGPSLVSGSNVPLTSLTAVPTTSAGANVYYPQAYTGGASPQTTGLAYTTSNGLQTPSGYSFPIGTTTQVTAIATDASGNTSSDIFDVTVLPISYLLSPTTIINNQTVTTANQFAVDLGLLVNQTTGSTFAGSSTPAIEQVGALYNLALQDAASLQTLPAFDQDVTTFLNNVLANGQTGSAVVQQEIVNLNAIAANGLTAAPFSGTSLTGFQVAPNGGVWFTCANGMLGYSQTGTGVEAVTVNNIPVQIVSLVVGSNGTAWFVTTGGQTGYCPLGQTAAILDEPARFVVSAPMSTAPGAAMAVTVTAQDAAGNVLLDYPGTVQFSSTDHLAGLPASYTFTPADQGSHTFNVTLQTAGTQTVTATAGSVSGQASIQVSSAFAANSAVFVAGTANTFSALVSGMQNPTFSESGALPAGISFSSSGVLGGTPALGSGGIYTLTLTAVSGSVSTSEPFTLTVDQAPIITSPNSTSWTTGTAASFQVTTAAGSYPGSITFSETGPLPAGLSFSSNGLLSGTPAANAGGSYSIELDASNGISPDGIQSFTLTIIPALTITTTALPAWTAQLAYTQTIDATGGTGAYSYAVTSGTLPTGLGLNSGSGVISGIPTTTGGSSSVFTITVTDSTGVTASQTFQVTINAAPTITPATLPNWTVDQVYHQIIATTGGTRPVTFAVTSGSLPTGLNLNTITGAITGTPTSTTGSPFDFTITAKDAIGFISNQAYRVVINALPTITTANLPNWSLGEAYDQIIAVNGGTSPDTFAVSAGSLPTGLSLNSTTGAITGTPTGTTGSPFAFTITATDAAGAAASATYSISINTNPVLSGTLPNWTVGQPFAQTLTLINGISPETFVVSSGSLPTGLSLNSGAGAITGTPTSTTGSPFNFTIMVTDSAGAVTSMAYSVVINAPPTITLLALPAGEVNDAYNQVITVAGGTLPDTFTVSTGSLPPGLSLGSGSGAISGTPTTTTGSPFVFTISATDGAGAVASQSYTLVINPALTITSTSLASGSTYQSYNQNLSVVGGSGSVTYAVSAGTLPAGLSLNSSTGTISGTPTESTLQTLASFSGTSARPESNLIEDSSGNLFGTTQGAGAYGDGSVFEVSGGILTTLVSFDGVDGSTPLAGLVEDSNGDLFGTTSQGGPSGDGTVFEIVHGTASITNLAFFNGLNGMNPQSSLVVNTSGDLFGTTSQGGPGGVGTVFEVIHGSNTVTTLAAFNTSDGANPVAGLVEDSSGNFFGTTSAGGPSGDGTVFEVAAGSHTLITLASFDNTNGANPQAGLVEDANGDLFGTTYQGGTFNDGTVFEVARASNTITTLVSFDNINGANPMGGLVEDASGNLFGTTQGGGTGGYGTLFEVAGGGNTFTSLASFNASSAYPSAGLVEDASGDLFGTTYQGGTSNQGTVFEMGQGSNTITTLASFSNNVGWYPLSGLVEDANGNLYGTTYSGGAGYSYGGGGLGTVFELAHGSNSLSTLASFNLFTGYYPEAGLVEDASGDLFGTTSEGGTSGVGTVFEITPGSNTITTLVSFDGSNGAYPASGLEVDANGNLFGTTSQGGAYGYGTVFEIARGSTTITTLVSFDYTDGAYPQDGLVQDASGDLFGTTYQGGGGTNQGTVFEIARGSNTITTLISFDGSNGAEPQAGLVMDAGGNLFGTTSYGGPSGYGTVFELMHGSNTLTTLVSFNDANGASPNALVEDANGDLFGTTGAGGSSGEGTVFEVLPGSNTLITLVSFDGSNGAEPQAGLVEDSNGDLFGTTAHGGIGGYGTVFEVASASFTITATDATGATASQAYNLTINAVPAITTTSLPNCAVGEAYSQTIATEGGIAPVTFTVSTGNLPTGLSLNSNTGVISGIPTGTTGSPFDFTVTATDLGGTTTSQVYTITINPALMISTASLPDWTIGEPYSQDVVATGGIGADTFSVSAGSLPPGLTLDGNTGLITGTPTTTSGSPFSFVITGTDANGATTSRTFTIAINPSPTIIPATLPTAVAGTLYNQTLTVIGGTTPYLILDITDFNGGSTGLTPASIGSDASTGTVTLFGIPASAGTVSFTVLLTDDTGTTWSQSFTVSVFTPTATTLTSTPIGPVTMGATVTFSAQISGDPSVGTVTFYAGPGLTNEIGSPVPVSNGSATSAAITSLPVGTDTITAVYSGGTGYTGSQGTETLVVDYATTTTLVANGPNPSLSGVGVGFTVTVSGGPAPSGETVILEDASNGNAVVGSATLSNGVANLTIGSLSVGSHNLFAVYGGDSTHAASQSTTVAQTVLTTFQVDSAVATPNGVVLTFDAPVNEATLRLYTTPGTTNPADVTVVGASTGPVKGSLVLDPTNPYLATFVKTIGLLATDTYTVTVTTAVQAVGGATLVTNYTKSLTGTAPTAPVVTVPYFARGAGQAVNLPANSAAGIPITLSGLSGALTSASFTLTYDPTLLTITAWTPAPGLSLTVTTTSVDAHHTQRTFTFSGSWTPGSSGTLVSLTASVPTSAPYLNKALLNLGNVTVNGASAIGQAAVDEAAYLGDVVGTRTLSGADATYINLVIASTASNAGFSAYKDLDPVIIGGIAYGEANVSSTDALRIEQKLVGTSVPTIPTIPTGITAPTGADPHLFLGSASVVAGQVVTVPEELVDTAQVAEPIFGVDSVLFFDPNRFTVVGVADGALLAGYGVTVNVDDALGILQVTQATASPLTLEPGVGGAALDIELRANPGDAGGSSVVKLASAYTRGGVTEATAVTGPGGNDTLTPAPQGSAPAQSQDPAAFVPGVDAVIEVTVATTAPQGPVLPTTVPTSTTSVDALLASALVRSTSLGSATLSGNHPTPHATDLAFQTVFGTPSVPERADTATGTSSLDGVWDVESVQDLTNHEVTAGVLLDNLGRFATGKRR